jgi:hypothetical protein
LFVAGLCFLLFSIVGSAQSIQLTKNKFARNERIKGQYNNVSLTGAVYIINVTAKKNPDNGLENYKYVNDTETGEPELRSMGYDGTYEVRIYSEMVQKHVEWFGARPLEWVP